MPTVSGVKIAGLDVATLASGEFYGVDDGGTGADMSATGGAGQFVKQTSVGGAFTTAVIGASDVPTGIDATKIADGTVTNAEFQFINSLTSNAQTQLDGKQPLDADLTQIAALTRTKGDIIAGTASAWTDLAVGVDGQVLTADSAQASGLIWATPVSSPASTFTATNSNAGAITRGTPVYIKADGTIDVGRANSLVTSDIAGFVQNTTVAAAATATIQVDGMLTATTGEWDAITGLTGGLVPGATYVLSSATAGRLTSTPPSTSGTQVSAFRILGKSTTQGQIISAQRLVFS